MESASSPFTAEEIQQIRRETPGTLTVNHLNNAGSSLMPLAVYEPFTANLRDELYLGGYEVAAKYQEELTHAYRHVAKLINASPEEIAFVESATIAWYKAFHSISFVEGDNILTCESEYGSNFIGFLQAKAKWALMSGLPRHIFWRS